jgi:hypothetical protein
MNVEEEVAKLQQNKMIVLMQKLQAEFLTATEDGVKFAQGNNSAGTRVRKAMQNIKNLAQEVRLEVQEQKNSVTA